jgi:hypothetical protein
MITRITSHDQRYDLAPGEGADAVQTVFRDITERKALEARLPAWEKRNIPRENFGGTTLTEGDNTDWKLTPVADIHLGPADGAGMTPTNSPKSIATANQLPRPSDS